MEIIWETFSEKNHSNIKYWDYNNIDAKKIESLSNDIPINECIASVRILQHTRISNNQPKDLRIYIVHC